MKEPALGLKRLTALLALGLALALGGCTSVKSESSQSPTQTVSPACKSARETVEVIEAHPGRFTEQTFNRESKELMHEECDAAARRRWTRIKQEQTPAAKAKKAEEVAQREAGAETETPHFTGEMVAEVMLLENPRMMPPICHAIEVTGPELALGAFENGYHPRHGEPSAAAVFAALAGHCR